MNPRTQKILISVVVLVVVIAMGFAIYQSRNSAVDQALITNFEECVAAGNPVMESYPRQCRSTTGELFVESVPENPGVTGPSPIVRDGCYVGGCSGQICSDQKDAVSTCEYRPQYACYQEATCERQSNGRCGWTEDDTLKACLSFDYDAVLQK